VEAKDPIVGVDGRQRARCDQLHSRQLDLRDQTSPQSTQLLVPVVAHDEPLPSGPCPVLVVHLPAVRPLENPEISLRKRVQKSHRQQSDVHTSTMLFHLLAGRAGACRRHERILSKRSPCTTRQSLVGLKDGSLLHDLVHRYRVLRFDDAGLHF